MKKVRGQRQGPQHCCLLRRPFGPHTARLHPRRTYYYRKNVDLEKVIEQCNDKVRQRHGTAPVLCAVWLEAKAFQFPFPPLFLPFPCPLLLPCDVVRSAVGGQR